MFWELAKLDIWLQLWPCKCSHTAFPNTASQRSLISKASRTET